MINGQRPSGLNQYPRLFAPGSGAHALALHAKKRHRSPATGIRTAFAERPSSAMDFHRNFIRRSAAPDHGACTLWPAIIAHDARIVGGIIRRHGNAHAFIGSAGLFAISPNGFSSSCGHLSTKGRAIGSCSTYTFGSLFLRCEGQRLGLRGMSGRGGGCNNANCK